MALKSFNILIKLHKRQIDILRRELRALEEERLQLLALSQSLQEEFTREMELSSHDAKMAGFFGAYSLRIRKRQEAIAMEMARLEASIQEKTEAIRMEFSEQKKYEIARQAALEQRAKKERNRQQAQMDDIGTQQFVRLKESVV